MNEALIKCHNEKKVLLEEIKDLRFKIATLIFWLITEWSIILTVLLNR